MEKVHFCEAMGGNYGFISLEQIPLESFFDKKHFEILKRLMFLLCDAMNHGVAITKARVFSESQRPTYQRTTLSTNQYRYRIGLPANAFICKNTLIQFWPQREIISIKFTEIFFKGPINTKYRYCR